MQPILSFIDHDRRRRIDHSVSDDHVAPHRQAVHEDRIVRSRHLLLRRRSTCADTARARRCLARCSRKTVFDAPALCIDDFGAVKRLSTSLVISTLPPAAAALLLMISHQFFIQFIASGCAMTKSWPICAAPARNCSAPPLAEASDARPRSARLASVLRRAFRESSSCPPSPDRDDASPIRD